jgi:RNA recognition motif-containing protein
MGFRVFVGNLPYNATESELREHFAAAGTLISVYLPTDRETGKPRGFAFLEFGESAQAQQAIARFNNQPFKGRSIAVNEARARDNRPPGGAPPRSPSRPPREAAAFEPPPLEPPGAGGGAGKNFGPDAQPRRNRKPAKSSARPEHRPKGPIRQKPGGQVFFGGDEADASEELEGENFASRVSDAEDGDHAFENTGWTVEDLSSYHQKEDR